MYNWVPHGLIPDDDKPAKDPDLSAADKNISSGINQRIQTLFKQQLYTDVTFFIDCDDKPQLTLKAHKAILAIGSDFFRQKFFEEKNDIGPTVIRMKNISYNSLKKVIKFLYTDEILFENDKNIFELLNIASKFGIQSLQDKCSSYIYSIELTETNVCINLQLAVDYNLAPLKEKCSKFIQENTANVIRSKDFQSINSSTVLFICEMEKLNLHSEKELLDCILEWATAQSNPPNETKLRFLVEPFLKHIRIMTFTPAEFNDIVQSYPSLFTAAEVSSILFSLGNRRTILNLPFICNNSASRCNRPFAERARHPDKNIIIPLRHCSETQRLSNLTSVLELNCLRGKHRIKNLKLSFDEPVAELRKMISVVISVSVKPSKYHFKEYIRIGNTQNVIVNFTRTIIVRQGSTATFKAEVKNAGSCKFLQFDESKSVVQDSPFVCSLASEPKENRLFFISGITFHSFEREFSKFNMND